MGDRFFDLANFSINHEFDDGRRTPPCSKRTSASSGTRRAAPSR